MPSFTSIHLENLLEPRTRVPYNNYSVNLKAKSVVREDEEEEKKKKSKPRARNHLYITPALYTTPEPTPILDSSSTDSLSPSPYVVNRKGRGGKPVSRRIDGFEVREESNGGGSCSSSGGQEDSVLKNSDGGLEGEVDKDEEKVVVEDNFSGKDGINDDKEKKTAAGVEVELDDDDGDGFFDPRAGETSSVVSSSADSSDFARRQFENLSVVSNQGEFFDADEDFSSDGSFSSSVPSSRKSIELELRATRLRLFEEIDKRKAAEDAVNLMYSQWQSVGNLLLSREGLKLPTPSNDSGNMQFDIDSVEHFCQELVITRFVAEEIGKGEARAEAEIAAEAIIQTKDQEISRLRDRLQYYEAVNREMSQRNQEIIEAARRQRKRKSGQQKWLWGCIGLSIAIGAAVIAHSFLPETSEHRHLLTSDNSSDASGFSSSENA